MRDKDISIHALRGEGDIASITARSSAYRFQSTPSVGRATISKNMGLVERVKFQSTPSVGRATKAHNGTDKMLEHFNPRPPWGGRPLLDTDCQSLSRISIHALRGEGDDKLIAFEDKLAISIHALRGEGDDADSIYSSQAFYFNPRPPWGGRLKIPQTASHLKSFQSTPSVGRATTSQVRPSRVARFQSTPSVGRATKYDDGDFKNRLFQSTPSVGRATTFLRQSGRTCRDFNPRPPWGGRPMLSMSSSK